MIVMRVLIGSHQWVASQMSAHADGELRGWRRWRVARHLAACEGCRAAFVSLLATLETLRGLAGERPAARPEIALLVRERIRREEPR